MARDHRITTRIDDDLRRRIEAFREAVRMETGVTVTEGEAVRVLVEKGLATVEKSKPRKR